MKYFFLFLLVLIACAPVEHSTKIGLILPLTGPGAQLGELYLQGAELAVADLNAKGHDIELVVEDTGSDSKNAVTAMKKLVEVDDIKLFATTMSTHGLALKPLAAEYNIVLFGDVAHPQMTDGGQNLFRHSQTANVEVNIIVNKLKELSMKKVGLLYSNEDYGNEFNRLLKVQFPESEAEAYDLKATDTRTEVAKLADNEAIIVVGVGPAFNAGIKQVKESGFTGPVFANIGFVISNTKDLPESKGVYHTDFPYTYLDKWSDFAQKFKTKYGKDAQALHPLGYGTIELIAAGVNKASGDQSRVTEELHNMGTFEGTDERMQISGNGDIPIPVVIVQN